MKDKACFLPLCLLFVFLALRADAVMLPPDFCLTGLPAEKQSTLEQALDRVSSALLQKSPQKMEVSALPELMQRGETALWTWHKEQITIPWDTTWVFLIDDHPAANWEHPCRYVFVSEDLSSIAVQYALTPLTVRSAQTGRSAGAVQQFEVIIPFVPPAYGGATGTVSAIRAPAPAAGAETISNCYAVIISGGANIENNHIRYWGDAAHIYSTLTLTFGYLKTNVYALISDGLDPVADRSDDTNSPFDLDGDGRPDTRASATACNISNVFIELQSRLTTNDQLFVFMTDHGGPTPNAGSHDVQLNLWNEEVLLDCDMELLTESLPCPVFFAMEQCFSGGFLDNLDQSNRVIGTAAYYNETSAAGDTYPYFDQWAYYWTSAMRGYYPQTNAPWLNAAPCDADLNDDGAVSFAEATQFAFDNKYISDNPMYQSNPDALGKQTFLHLVDPDSFGMGELDVEPLPALLVRHLATPLCVSAQNVFGKIITNYTGTARLCAEAEPIDPGVYIGDGLDNAVFPLDTTYMDCRTQVIYPQTLMGEARTLENIQLSVIDPPTILMSNLTIRLKHTALTLYPTNPVWETEGWTTVYTSNILLTTNGWITFSFDTPFEYNGIDSLMVDFTFHNTNYDDGGTFRVTHTADPLTLNYLSDNEDGRPLTWSNRTPVPNAINGIPNLRMGPPPIPVTVNITPTNLTDFNHGVWTGMVTVLNTADCVRLCVVDAENSAWQGTSGPFQITDSCRTNYADATSMNPVYPYATLATAATSLQDVLDAASTGAVVLAASGCYTANGSLFAGVTSRAVVGKGVMLRSINGPAVTHIAGAPDPSGDADGLGPAAIRGAALQEAAVLDGFTIYNGCTTTNGAGGGIYAEASSSISNCILRNNAAGIGGGIYAADTVRVATCLLVSNRSHTTGGGIHLDGSGTISACTISTNSAALSGGGVYFAQQSAVAQSILYFNHTGFSGPNLYDASGSSLIEYCCLLPDPGGTGNITENPAFANTATQNYRLTVSSPCVDAGPLNAPKDNDLDQVRRPLDGRAGGAAIIDMGAYEYFNVIGDTDADGMRDGWEAQHGLDVYNPADALQNPDEDPAKNVWEALADTDPFNADSYLQINTLLLQPAPTLQFHPASTNRAYTVWSTTNLADNVWSNQSGATPFIPPALGNQSIALQNLPATNTTRTYYRLKVDYIPEAKGVNPDTHVSN